MHLKYLMITLIFLFSACSSNPPKAPEPRGKATLVNPPEINIQDLK